MQIQSIAWRHWQAPFKAVVRHASASRREAASVLVTVTDKVGRRGIGEGCPRAYVTGETMATADAFLAAHGGSAAAEISDLAGLEAWAAEHAAEIDDNPAAFCALELAILDLLGQQSGQSLEGLLDLPPMTAAARYSAVLGLSPLPLFLLQSLRYRLLGMDEVKLKVGADATANRRRVMALRRVFGPALRLRVDANNLWQEPAAAIAALSDLGPAVTAVEEPLTAGDIAGATRVAEALGVPVILDESFLHIRDLAGLSQPSRWILNLRVSKLGGLLRSVAVVRAARARGFRLVVGAHVGESSILTRAGLTLAQAAGPALAAMEGGFGRRLLRSEPVARSLTFGSGGRLPLDGAWYGRPGLGLGAVGTE